MFGSTFFYSKRYLLKCSSFHKGYLYFTKEEKERSYLLMHTRKTKF